MRKEKGRKRKRKIENVVAIIEVRMVGFSSPDDNGLGVG